MVAPRTLTLHPTCSSTRLGINTHTLRLGQATAEAAELMRGHITHSLTATAISALEDFEGSGVA